MTGGSMEEILEMSEKERDRFVILRQIVDKRLTQKAAAKILKITDRQIRNLLKRWKKEGDKGFISKKRGKPSNHQYCSEKKKKILEIVKEQLEGYGPTLACEKLNEIWSISCRAETLRMWMIEEKIPYPDRRKKKVKIHKPRERRSCLGEMVQLDGSHHRWFGPDSEMINLMVFIDDAIGKLTALHFSKGETLEAYYTALREHLLKYGRPPSTLYRSFCSSSGTTRRDDNPISSESDRP